MDEPEGPQHVLGNSIGKAGKCPGLPALPLPVGALETGLQPCFTGLAGSELLLQLNELPSNLLNQNKAHTQTHKNIKKHIKIRNNNNTKLIKNKTIYTPRKGQRGCQDGTAQKW